MYRIDIQQGNVVTKEMVEELAIGMDKRQVRFLLGTPLVADAFHQDRWDYVYTYQPGGGKRVQQRVSLFFRNEQLARIDSELDPDLNLHTVVDARDTVITVPPRKRGFFATLANVFTGDSATEEHLDTGSSPIAGDADTAAVGGLQEDAPQMEQGEGISGSVDRDVQDVEGAIDPSAAEDATATGSPSPPADAPPAMEPGTGAKATPAPGTATKAGEAAGATTGIKPTETYAPNVADTAPPQAASAPAAEASPAAPRSGDDESFLKQLFQGYGKSPSESATRDPTFSPPPVRD